MGLVATGPGHRSARGTALACAVLLGAACLLPACAAPRATATTAARHVDPARPPRRAPPPPPCLTIYDQELSCTRTCDPLGPAVQRCAGRFLSRSDSTAGYYRVVVHATSDGQGGVDHVRVELPTSAPADLVPVGDCITGVFRRFVPCHPLARGKELTFPVMVVPGR